MFAFNSVSSYLVDAFPNKSASAIAVNNFARSITARIFVFAAAPFEDAIGVGWVYTVLIFISFIGILGLFVISIKGKDWRERTGSIIEV